MLTSSPKMMYTLVMPGTRLRTSSLALKGGAIGGLSFGLVGGIVGLIVGVRTYAPTAPFAVIEAGVPSAVLGAVLGTVTGAIVGGWRWLRCRARGGPGGHDSDRHQDRSEHTKDKQPGPGAR